MVICSALITKYMWTSYSHCLE